MAKPRSQPHLEEEGIEFSVGDDIFIDTWLDGKPGEGTHIVGDARIEEIHETFFVVRIAGGITIQVPPEDCR